MHPDPPESAAPRNDASCRHDAAAREVAVFRHAAVPVPPSQRRMVGRLVVPPKRYKVGELAAATGLSRQTLHNYTKWGLIGETGWTEGGHRLYDESVFARLERVMRLKAEMTVEQVRELLEQEARQAREAEEQAA